MRNGLMWYVALSIVALVLVPADVAAHETPEPDAAVGRWIYLNNWAGIVRCESEGDAQATNRWSGADGLFQFMPATWRSVAETRGRPKLTREAPSNYTVAQQLRQALWLRRNVSIRQWACWRHWGTGSKWVWVTGEIMPKDPERCARNLQRHHGRGRKLAESVCGVS